MEPSGSGDMVTLCRQRPRLTQRNGGKVSQKRSGKEEGGGGRGWRREGGVRRKEQGGRTREGEKRTVVEGGARGKEAKLWI